MKTNGPLPRVPAGYVLIPVKTTYLEMQDRPETEPIALPAGCAVARWSRPGLSAYRKLFRAVGGEWGWSGRLILPDDELKAVIQAPTTEIHRLRCGGRLAGFGELERSRGGEVEIAYFGLLPEFIGRGLGRFLLDWTIRKAWAGETRRVWLHTCEFDHPQALAVYGRAGFRVYGERTETQPYARKFVRRRGGG